ncbi:MAG: leucine-rich repeat domain-containing protein [Bacteroidota bacterium]
METSLAQRLIADCKKNRSPKLDLGYCGLTAIPEEVFELTWLEELYLCNTYFDYTQRKWVHSENRAQSEGINRLDALPPRLSTLTLLRTLFAGGGYYGPWRISNISVLKKLTQLQTLDLSDNNINNISVLEKLTQLQTLDLSDTKIADLSPLLPFIEKGVSVKWDRFVRNAIKVEDCPLTVPPVEIVKQGNEAILNYFRQIKEQAGTEPLYEAKMLIVGEPGAGKTTLLKKLDDPNYIVPKGGDPKIKSTVGINILEG